MSCSPSEWLSVSCVNTMSVGSRTIGSPNNRIQYAYVSRFIVHTGGCMSHNVDGVRATQLSGVNISRQCGCGCNAQVHNVKNSPTPWLPGPLCTLQSVCDGKPRGDATNSHCCGRKFPSRVRTVGGTGFVVLTSDCSLSSGGQNNVENRSGRLDSYEHANKAVQSSQNCCLALPTQKVLIIV